ncbi:unnamed protein product [Bathycoccus prasinos]
MFSLRAQSVSTVSALRNCRANSRVNRTVKATATNTEKKLSRSKKGAQKPAPRRSGKMPRRPPKLV